MEHAPIEIAAAELKRLLDEPEQARPLTLVDCREQEERQLVRLEPSLHVPMSKLPEGLQALDEHKASPLVVYCHHGIRSQNVATWLREQGFADVRSLAGGIDGWALEIEPGMVRY